MTDFIAADRLRPQAEIDSIQRRAQLHRVAFQQEQLRNRSPNAQPCAPVLTASMPDRRRAMETLDRTRTDRIAALNDRVRQNLDRNARIVFTHGCLATFDDGNAATAIRTQAMIMRAIRSHDFDDDDTYRERDFGAFDFRGERLFFKIDYYDSNLEFGSDDPSDAAKTRRVMTIMLASDY